MTPGPYTARKGNNVLYWAWRITVIALAFWFLWLLMSCKSPTSCESAWPDGVGGQQADTTHKVGGCGDTMPEAAGRE